MNLLFLEYKADIIEKLGIHGFVQNDCKLIDYGEQLKFHSDKVELKITLYYNKKNQFKYVINKVTPDAYINTIQAKLNNLTTNNFQLSPLTTNNYQLTTKWAGSDESGKGDYFGPLVVAAFVCDKVILARLTKYGVNDSKLIDEENLVRIAEKVLLEFHGNYQYFVLLPEKYNELYPKFSIKKPGLNEMLAWMHSKVIGDLHSRHRFPKVIIDKFANEKLIKSFVSKTCDAELQIVTRAESDIAVATASIIARYLYLKNLSELSNKYGIRLLKGASLKVQELRRSLDKEILPYVCKMHFK